ncbi:MAG: hypothetical protein PWR20_2257 [Bacteroidales bacterium]|jgi:hypothetical protein|nr:hypothetical protein [Bacteroidales bacterium]MDN5329720.1 hypothetical protein [Bacteroidales bacterium]
MSVFCETTFWGIPFINPLNFMELLVRFIFNLISLIILVRYIYYVTARRKTYLFTYMLIGITIFSLSYLLENVKLELGLALGLFAVFGIIRYRTDNMPIKEMTYLFVVIALSIINALTTGISIAELIFTNAAILIAVGLGEYFWMYRHESSKPIVYDNLEYIKPQNKKLFIQDLERRTGLKINRVEVGQIDFSKETVKLVIYYFYDKKKVDFFEEKAFDENSFLTK